MHLLEIDGYFVCCWLLSPVGFGVPQHRLRSYVVAVPKFRLDMTAEEAEAFCHHHMNLFVGSKLQSLADYILPGNDVNKQYMFLLGKQALRDGHSIERCLLTTWGVTPLLDKQFRKPYNHISWPARHMKIFARRGEDWASSSTDPEDEIKFQFPVLVWLKAREFDRLHL